jgi:hypothetical protein
MSSSQCNCRRSKDSVRIIFRKHHASGLRSEIRRFLTWSPIMKRIYVPFVFILTGFLSLIPASRHGLCTQLGPGGYVDRGEVLIFKGSPKIETNVSPPGQMHPKGPPTFYLAQPILGYEYRRGEQGAAFGVALATGDLNADGYQDLIVGAPRASVIGTEQAGMVFIFFGSSLGWPSNISPLGSRHPTGPPVIFLASPLLGSETFRGERVGHFGATLVTGDFNGDGVLDLAVGAPEAALTGVRGSGAVTVFYSQSSIGIPNNVSPGGRVHPRGGRTNQLMMPVVAADFMRGEEDAHFGHAIASGDIDGDGYDDLIVGAPDASPRGVDGAGLVHVFYGTANGIKSNISPAGVPTPEGGRYTVLSQAKLGTNSFRGEPRGGFGGAVATGDINGDGYDDLAIAAPHADPIGVKDAGVVQVYYGSAEGIANNIIPAGRVLPDAGVGTILVQPWVSKDTQRSYPGAFFGAALAIGDINGDRFADLIIGAPGTDLRGIKDSGLVYIFYGSRDGISTNISPAGIPNPSHGPHDIIGQPVAGYDYRRGVAGAKFGAALAIGLVDGDDYADLIVGAPYSHVRGIEMAGQVIFFPGNAEGIKTNVSPAGRIHLDGSESVLLTQPPFEAQRGEEGAHFGIAVSAGDGDKDGYCEIIAGLFGEKEMPEQHPPPRKEEETHEKHEWKSHEKGEDKNQQVELVREIADVWIVPHEQTITVGGTAHFNLYIRYKKGDPAGKVIEPDLKKTYTKPGKHIFKKRYKKWKAEAIVYVKESEPPPVDSSGCPTSVPKEAKHYEGPNFEYWKMPNGKYVGPYRKWYDNEKTKPSLVKCYNTQGILSGPAIRWFRNGKMSHHENYKEGKFDGLCRSWHEEPYGPKWEVEWKDGKRNGVYKSYAKNGNPLTDETYEDGKLIKATSYDADGNIRMIKEGTFRGHIVINGTITTYKPLGNTVVETYSNGKLVSRSEQ